MNIVPMKNDNKFIRPTIHYYNTGDPESGKCSRRIPRLRIGTSGAAYFVADFRYAMRSPRSLGFFSPANTIFVPGMYFFGFSRYSKRVSSFHVIPVVIQITTLLTRCQATPTQCLRLRNGWLIISSVIYDTFRFVGV